MEQADVGLMVLLGIALVMAVFAALAETSLLRSSKVRVQSLASGGDRKARRLHGLQEDLPRVLNAVLLLALLSQIGAAAVAGLLAQRWFGNAGVTISSVVLTLVLFVYGEAIPKTYAVLHAERVGRLLAAPIQLLATVLRPVVSALVWFADLQAPGKGVSTGPTITEDELKLLTRSAAREGEITHEDRRLIERAFRLGDRHADDVMVPRTELVGVEITDTPDEALRRALASGHRRLPVFDGDLDNIVGLVRVRDLADTTVTELAELVTPALFAPESKRVLDLLREMQHERVHLAIVVDEHGGTAGLITVEDVVEELFGDIGADPAKPPIEVLDDGWEVDGALPVEDLVDIIDDDELLAGNWNTAAGLMMGRAGRVPEPGDEVRVGDTMMRVIEMDGRRITRLGITPIGAEDGERGD